MAERPGGRGPTLYEVAGWLQGAVGVPFRAAGWLSRRDKPEIDRNDWRLARLGIALGAILGLLALTLLTRTLLIAFGLIDGVDRWSELRNSLLVIGVIVGAPFVVWRTMIADRQTAINQQTHYTDLYTKAVEMLGADKVEKRDGKERSVPNIEVRLGAIYALQRVMNQSDADYLPILKTLCAYVRENATFQERPSFSEGPPLPEPPEPPEARDETPEELAERLAAIRLHAQNLRDWGARLRAKATARGAPSAQRPDIRAALDVLCDRPEKRRLKLEGIERLEPPAADILIWAAKGVRLDLAGAVLQGASRADTDLRRTNLTGAQMHGANIAGARMQGAVLANAYFQGAVLTEARMQGAVLSGARMQGAVLAHARMQGTILADARMQGAVLVAARMQGAVLFKARLQGAVLRQARMWKADLDAARMQGADLEEARMQGAILTNATLQGANLNRADMQGADLYNARMQGADLRRAQMQGADLLAAQMQHSILIGADMQGAVLIGAVMHGADLSRALLQGANLSMAKLNSATISRARLAGALLAGAEFVNTTNLTYSQLASAFGDAATKLPPDLDAERPRLIAEAGWAEDEIPEEELDDRWAAWRAKRTP